MPRRVLLAAWLLVGCGGGEGDDDDAQADAQIQGTFSLADLAGEWSGKAHNNAATLNLKLTVDSGGNVTGSGGSSTWSITGQGEVSGTGTQSVAVNDQVVDVSSRWTLTMTEERAALAGTLFLNHSGLYLLTVTLAKTGGGAPDAGPPGPDAAPPP